MQMSGKKSRKASRITTRNKVRLIRGGKEYFDLIVSLIDQAESSIHLQTYIFEDDATGQAVATALKRAAQRKVAVYVLVDGYASQGINAHFIDGLKLAGIQFRFFAPLLKSRHFYFGRRLHHKVFVADGRISLTGGINISDRYNDMPGNPAWLDFALYAEGEAARELCILCWKTWYGFPLKMGLTPCETTAAPTEWANYPEGKIKMCRNDWVRRKIEISVTYFDMFRNANSQITILCSYFLPGKVMRKLLSKATARGVKVTVIIAGPSDVMLAKLAEKWLYDWLLRNNIEIYEYQPAVLHAKLAVCDGEWFTVGSYNINDISAYASIELNLDVYDPVLTGSVVKMIQQEIIPHCLPIDTNDYLKKRRWYELFVRFGAYHITRLFIFLFTFYYKHEDR